MSMYLSNRDLYPTGAEPAEFIDFPPSIEEVAWQRNAGATAAALDRLERAGDRNRLPSQTDLRVAITSRSRLTRFIVRRTRWRRG